jgi:hypothetical protein
MYEFRDGYYTLLFPVLFCATDLSINFISSLFSGIVYKNLLSMFTLIYYSIFLSLLIFYTTAFPLFLSPCTPISTFSLFSTFSGWFSVLSHDIKRKSVSLLKFTSNYLNYLLKTLGKSSFCVTNSEKRSSSACISIKGMICFIEFAVNETLEYRIYLKSSEYSFDNYRKKGDLLCSVVIQTYL